MTARSFDPVPESERDRDVTGGRSKTSLPVTPAGLRARRPASAGGGRQTAHNRKNDVQQEH